MTYSLLFLPDAIGTLRSDAVAALTYTSNWWQMIAHRSYFAQAGRPELLKHLWSLAIEEQFYLAWPFLLMLGLRRLGRQRMLVTMLGTAMASTLLLALVSHGSVDDAYYATSHVSLGNYISMVSGQVPQPLDHFDCPTYAACVRPGPTIGAQLDGAGKTWRGYFETMPAPCTRPTGATDTNQTGYATRHNPFVYFSEIVNDAAYCADRDVPYETSFAPDLSGGSPRNLSFIVPNTCNDGHDAACAGTQTQIQVLDGWLAANVPPILSYVNAHPDSALIITFDEASNSETEACCEEMPGPGSPSPGITGPGGGRVGAVLLSPFLFDLAGR